MLGINLRELKYCISEKLTNVHQQRREKRSKVKIMKCEDWTELGVGTQVIIILLL